MAVFRQVASEVVFFFCAMWLTTDSPDREPAAVSAGREPCRSESDIKLHGIQRVDGALYMAIRDLPDVG